MNKIINETALHDTFKNSVHTKVTIKVFALIRDHVSDHILINIKNIIHSDLK